MKTAVLSSQRQAFFSSQVYLIENVLINHIISFCSHQVEQPLRSKKCVWQKLLSKQRKRAVVACFRMAPLYNLPRYDGIHYTFSLHVLVELFVA